MVGVGHLIPVPRWSGSDCLPRDVGVARWAFPVRDNEESVTARCYSYPVHEGVLVAGRDAVDSEVDDSSRGSHLTNGTPVGRYRDHIRRSDFFGLAWVLVSGIAILVPILRYGHIFGPFDFLSRASLTKQPGVSLHIYQNTDLINALIPWSNEVWRQVHQGHLPLWNPYGGLGMPLAFNWQSAPLSLSSVVGYLAPIKYAFTVGVIVNIVVAGSGAYLLGRVLRMGVLASAAVGTVFELSGPITAWLGFPFSAVMSWAGWIFAIGLLLVRGRHRAGGIVALALCVALSLYGGGPEGFTVLIMAFTVFFATVLLCRARWLGGSGPILRPTFDLVAAIAAGGALAAPFALPGLQVVSQSVRSGPSGSVALPSHTLTYLAVPAFDGLPIFHHGQVVIFGLTYFYTETAMYVGVSALILAGMAVVLQRRAPEVRGFSAVVAVCLALVFVWPVIHLAGALPLVGRINWVRALMPLALAVAALAGYGLDLVVRSRAARRTGRQLGLGFGIAAVALIGLWTFGRGHLDPSATSVRAHSFIWPVVETAIGLAIGGFLLCVGRYLRRVHPDDHSPPVKSGTGGRWILRWSGPVAGLGLLAAQTAFLVSAGATMVESSPTSFPQTPTVRELAYIVGSDTVAFGSTRCGLGIVPNVNDVYGVHELAVYDPIIPKDYFSAWRADSGTAGGSNEYNLFCPVVTSATVAREFGVSYVLEAAGEPGPVGSVYVRRLGDEDLYRIPGSGEATVEPLSAGKLPPIDLVGTPVAVDHPSPSRWHLTTSSKSPQVLRLHLTDTPGWQSTIDGKPLKLESYAGMMLQARIPAGDHTIELNYWPHTFTEGIVVALASATGLLGLLVVASIHKRRGSEVDGVSRDEPASPVL